MRFTIADDIGVRCFSMSDRNAIEVVGTSVCLSYRALWCRVAAFAAALASVATGRHGRLVALLLPNDVDAVVAYIASQVAEVIAVPLNSRLSDAEIETILRDCDCRLLLTAAPHYATAQRIANRLGNLTVLDAAGVPDLAQVDRPSFGTRERSHEPCVIGYTSGTTGLPKGAVYSHEHYSMNSYRWGWEFGLTADHVVLIPGPVCHLSYAGFALAALAIGARVRIMREFSAATVVDELGSKSTFALLVPSMLAMAVEEWRSRGSPPLEAARFVVSAGAPVPITLTRTSMEMFPNAKIAEIYGWTEGGYATFEVKHPETLLPHSVGWPALGADVRLFRDDGAPCAVGEAGEVGLRAVTRFLGYLGRPEETQAAWQEDYLMSGDIGILQPDGRLSIVDRKKDMVISGGENIHTAEVERVLCEHPSVAEVAVVGMRDERWGEIVTAAVVVRPGRTLTLEETRAFCRAQLAAYKLPKRLELLDQLPRNAMGKVQKRRLVELLRPHGNRQIGDDQARS